MKAITLWPEWAYAICHLGKRIENRGWVPPKNLGEFAIHAGKNIGGTGRSPEIDVGLMLQIASDAGFRWGGLPYRKMSKKEMRDLIDKTIAEITALSSSIVAVANVSHVLPKRPSGIEGWHMPDSFGWVLGDVRVLSPIACRGSQGLWEPPHLVYASIQRQIAGIA